MQVLNPSSLVVLGLLAAAWFYLFIVRQASITIGGRPFRWALCQVVDHPKRTHPNLNQGSLQGLDPLRCYANRRCRVRFKG